jgi:hypothetical protein
MPGKWASKMGIAPQFLQALAGKMGLKMGITPHFCKPVPGKWASKMGIARGLAQFLHTPINKMGLQN